MLNKYKIKCTSQKDAKSFLKLLTKYNVKWRGGEPMNETHYNNEDIMYKLNSGLKLTYGTGYCSYDNDNKEKIITFVSKFN